MLLLVTRPGKGSLRPTSRMWPITSFCLGSDLAVYVCLTGGNKNGTN